MPEGFANHRLKSTSVNFQQYTAGEDQMLFPSLMNMLHFPAPLKNWKNRRAAAVNDTSESGSKRVLEGRLLGWYVDHRI